MTTKKHAASDKEDEPDTTLDTTAAVRPAAAILTVGRILLFTNEEGTSGPAIITQVEEVPESPSGDAPVIVRANLCFFDPVMGPRNYYVQDVAEALAEMRLRWPGRA